LQALFLDVASGRDLLREVKPSTAKEVVPFANPDFDLISAPMLAKADNGSSDPSSKSIPIAEFLRRPTLR
jgi:hypothetical protein